LSEDRGINERRDANPKHMRVYNAAMGRCFDEFLESYGVHQLNLWMLITHPDFRRRGAGTLLCNWGEEEAAKRQWDLTVMASPMGRLLYEHLCYKLIGSIKVQAEGEEQYFDIYALVKKLT
jgi:ribosomal protein S18 acetylase RimI-like enzyme